MNEDNNKIINLSVTKDYLEKKNIEALALHEFDKFIDHDLEAIYRQYAKDDDMSDCVIAIFSYAFTRGYLTYKKEKEI